MTNTRVKQANALGKAIRDLSDGHPFMHRRDVLSRNEDCDAAYRVANGISSNRDAEIEHLLRQTIGTAKYSTQVSEHEIFVICYHRNQRVMSVDEIAGTGFARKNVAGMGRHQRTGNLDADIGRATLKAMFHAAAKNLRSRKQEVFGPAYKGLKHGSA